MLKVMNSSQRQHCDVSGCHMRDVRFDEHKELARPLLSPPYSHGVLTVMYVGRQQVTARSRASCQI